MTQRIEYIFYSQPLYPKTTLPSELINLPIMIWQNS